MKRQNGHFWLPLARRVETSVSPMIVGAAVEQAVDEKMDEELPAVCSSGAEAWRTHARGALSPRGNALAVPRLVSPLRPMQDVRPPATDSLRERRANRRWCTWTPVRFGEDEQGDQRRMVAIIHRLP